MGGKRGRELRGGKEIVAGTGESEGKKRLLIFEERLSSYQPSPVNPVLRPEEGCAFFGDQLINQNKISK